MPKINIEQHRELESAGFLHIKQHASAPLLIHNYSQKAQYDRHWVAATLASRGLVTDLDGHIVARPFGKFFNLDEHIGLFGALPAERFEVYDKMDGSLGILFFWEGKPQLATRGSFDSDQALVAQEIFRQKYAALNLRQDCTYLLEIIYPENRIVVNYGEMQDLVLLGVIETRTGLELPLENWGFPVVKRYDGIEDIEQLRQIQEENREGFVIKFESGLRVKLKFEEYVRLHRILTGVSSRVIWEALRSGTSLDDYLEHVPDEFYDWVKKTAADFHDAFAQIDAVAKNEFRSFDNRKEAALYYQSSTSHPPIMFKMLDGKAYDQIIWKMLEPEFQRPFHQNLES